MSVILNVFFQEVKNQDTVHFACYHNVRSLKKVNKYLMPHRLTPQITLVLYVRKHRFKKWQNFRFLPVFCTRFKSRWRHRHQQSNVDPLIKNAKQWSSMLLFYLAGTVSLTRTLIYTSTSLKHLAQWLCRAARAVKFRFAFTIRNM